MDFYHGLVAAPALGVVPAVAGEVIPDAAASACAAWASALNWLRSEIKALVACWI
jgi:hypothetical protein